MESNFIKLQYYNYSLLSYNNSHDIHSLPWEANSGVTFLGQFFQPLSKKMQNISVALSLSILHTYFFRMIILWGEHVYLVRSGGAQITWCTTFSWTFCKEHGLSCTRHSNLSSREYFWQGKISVCKVLVLIEVVPVKNDYFIYAKFGLHDILSFCIDAVLLEKIWRIY